MPQYNLKWDGVEDLVSRAVNRGQSSPGRLSPELGGEAARECRNLLDQARRDGAFRASLPRALELVTLHPESEAVQIYTARLIMEGGDNRQALVAWRAILERHPEAIEPLRLYIRLLRQISGPDIAAAALEEWLPGLSASDDPARTLQLAMALEELGQVEQAERQFLQTTQLSPNNAVAWNRLAKLQTDRGAIHEAEKTLAMGVEAGAGKRLLEPLAKLRRQIETLESLAVDGNIDDQPMSVTAIEFIVHELRPIRESMDLGDMTAIGPLVFIGGSLGSGGAERQLVTCATELHKASHTGEIIAETDILGPISVCVRNLNPALGNDFFLAELESAGIDVSCYMQLLPYGGRMRASAARELAPSLDFLPVRMQEGLTQLVDHLRSMAPDVAYIWQDGMIFATALAAIVARVPRILLGVRTMPPSARLNRMKLEHEPLYRALLSLPGVTLCANSAVAARAYEDWLRLPRFSVPVIHNGIAPLPNNASQTEEQLWQDFDERTAKSSFTLGGVMRLDDNKRPLDWLEVAALTLQNRPDARFVLVGDGVLFAETQEFAARLGLSNRILFVGRSRSVGFWLGKLDALLLVSQFEGTPNILIEAQSAGVPVVTTPAGAAEETLIHGVSGYVLQSADRLDHTEAARHLEAIASLDTDARAAMAKAARDHARHNYSVESMLGQTVSLMTFDVTAPVLDLERA